MIARCFLLVLALACGFAASAADRRWVAQGAQSSALFSNPANWDGGTVPALGDRLFFDDTSWGVFVNDLGYAFDSMVFQVPGNSPAGIGTWLHEMRGQYVLANAQPLTMQGYVAFPGTVFVLPNATLVANGANGSAMFSDLVLGGGVTSMLLTGPAANTSTNVFLAVRDTDGASSLALDCGATTARRCWLRADAVAIGGDLVVRNAGRFDFTGGEDRPFDARQMVFDTDYFLAARPLHAGSLRFQTPVTAVFPGVTGADTAFDQDSTAYFQTLAGAVTSPATVASGAAYFNVAFNQGNAFTLPTETIAKTGAVQVGSFLVRSSAVVLAAPEALSGSTAITFPPFYFYSDEGGDYRNDATFDLGPFTQTASALRCPGTYLQPMPVSGPLRMTPSRSLLRLSGSSVVANCTLVLTVPADLDVSGMSEIPLVQMLGGATMTGMFTQLVQGTPVMLNGQRFYANYRRGFAGQDLVLSRDFHRCAVGGNFRGDCRAGIVRVNPAAGSEVLDLMSNFVSGRYPNVSVTHVADFDVNNLADLLGVAADQSIVMRPTAIGAGDWITLLPGGTGWYPKLVGDFNGDLASDILWEHTDGSYALWLMLGSQQAGGARLFGPGTGWRAQKVADFNGDGHDDILWAHPDGRVAIWLMRNGVQVGGGVVLPAGTGWSFVATGDFNGDGKADILWQHADGTPAIWIMDGTTVVAGARLFGAGTGWSAKVTGDFDGDGRADIAWQHTDGSVAVWFMNGATQVAGGVYRRGSGPAPLLARERQGRDMLVLGNADGSYDWWLVDRSGVTNSGSVTADTGYQILR